jgi:hypothetical protein
MIPIKRGPLNHYILEEKSTLPLATQPVRRSIEKRYFKIIFLKEKKCFNVINTQGEMKLKQNRRNFLSI